LVTAAISAAFLMKAPSGRIMQAVADPDGLTAAIDQLAVAVGIPPGEMKENPSLPRVEGADAVVEWAKGLAHVDSTTGRVLMLSQQAQDGDITAELQDYAELDRRAMLLAELLGWDEVALAEEGFRSDESGLLSAVMCLYHKTWVSYTSQGVCNNGLIEVKLDGRDGQLVGFHYFPGAGELPVDTAKALSQEQAEAIAEKNIEEVVLQQIRILAAEDQAVASRLTWDTRESVLKITSAPAVTGGETKLVWVVSLGGKDGTGSAVAGTVYIDAMTGTVLQQLR
jgi:hypothetical protein